MGNIKVHIYDEKGTLVGYFQDPKIEAFGQGEYEICGCFYDLSARLTAKLAFNPQALPYLADLSNVQDVHKLPHRKLKQVYVQSGRQPVRMTGQGE
jgi:hypothetical protein